MNNLISQLKKDEGYRQFAYTCTAGKLTIGYGLNIDPDESGPGLPEKVASMLLDARVDEITRELWNIDGDLMVALTPVRQDVVVMMSYQLGVYGFMGFKKTIAYLKNKQWVEAAGEMLDSEWGRDKYTAARAHRLSFMIQNGVYWRD